MQAYTQILVNSAVLLLAGTTLAQAAGPEPATVTFQGQGFTVKAPAGASLLELRVADPDRELIFAERTPGDPITWYLGGTPVEGEYRYEAVTVTKTDGKPRQAIKAGGFTVEGGVLVAPSSMVAD